MLQETINTTANNTVPIILALIAAGAVIVGPLLSLWGTRCQNKTALAIADKQNRTALATAKRQNEAALAIAYRQNIGPMREKWIGQLREFLAEFLSLASVNYIRGSSTGAELNLGDEGKRMLHLSRAIGLLVDTAKDDHVELLECLNKMFDALRHIKDPEADKQFREVQDDTYRLSRKIFKTEWNRISKEFDPTKIA